MRQPDSKLEPSYYSLHAHPAKSRASNQQQSEDGQKKAQQDYSAALQHLETIQYFERMLKSRKGWADLQEAEKEIENLEGIAESCSDEALSHRARKIEEEIKSRAKSEVERLDSLISGERSSTSKNPRGIIEFVFGGLPDCPESRIIKYKERRQEIIRVFRL